MSVQTAGQVTERTRYCSGCEQVLPQSAWYTSTPSGKCRECRKAHQNSAAKRGEVRTYAKRLADLERIVAELSEKLSARVA